MGQVSLSETYEKALVAKITEAVTKQRESDLLEQFKQFALQSAELTRAKEDLSRKDAEIADLRARLAQFSSLLASPQIYQQPIVAAAPAPTWPVAQPQWTPPMPTPAAPPAQAPAASPAPVLQAPPAQVTPAGS